VAAVSARIVLVAVVAALAVAAPAGAAPEAKVSLTVASSDYGRIVFDGRGFALYAFTADRAGRSVCDGACAKAWPPYLVKSAPRAGPGTKQRLLGTIRRAGSRQLTYAGRPLYYYVGEKEPHLVLCQNVREFGGLWLVVRPGGTLVR
jgi:predicted lipoprotein with Yx(FWY)xxD motif